MNSVLGPERPANISSGMPGRFVLAAGSRPQIPPIAGLADAPWVMPRSRAN